MLNKSLNIEPIKNWLLQQFPTLQGAYLFGSLATGFANNESDLDLAILVPDPIDNYTLWEKAQELSLLIKLEVDLVNLISANTVFQFQIISSGKRIFCKEKYICDLFETFVFSSYVGLNESRKKIIDDYILRNKNG